MRRGAGVRMARCGWVGRRLAKVAMRSSRGRKTDSRRAIRSSPGWGGRSCATGTGLCHAHVMDGNIRPATDRRKR
jgi:hypothetical protein